MTRTAGTRTRLRAVLGPTNTGKTHLAIERMLAQPTGVIGFPLRLLARENYDRVAARVGRGQVALITGEEKIAPPQARYFLCTVEAMPVDIRADFLAVDEIQLCADPERGHVFTDRLLHARGREETLFLGADSMAGMIRRLVPGVEIESRPRLSTLAHVGRKKLTRLPRRSAVVAFSAGQVYEAAEILRRQRGGAAVVLGALSPRTRNAQVAMYEAGEVDFLVATDAIGMGLNMDVDHVAFAGMSKFDGRRRRPLAPEEVAQIAGRAGRHMNDGSFGVTGTAPDLDEGVVERVENHRFDPLEALVWRARDLDFRSPRLLLRSLEAAPGDDALIRQAGADDQRGLAALAADPRIAKRASTPDRVRLLWEVCRIPDFRKIAPDQHTELLATLFRLLVDNDGVLPRDWTGAALTRLDRTDGDIDTITQRLAHVRIWAYVGHRADWLVDAPAFQARARAIEDKLSDALHRGLLNRFVDATAAAIGRRRKGRDSPPLGAVAVDGTVLVEGHRVGAMAGLAFAPDDAEALKRGPGLAAAVAEALRVHMPGRVARLEASPDEAFTLHTPGLVHWKGAPVARLARGTAPLAPAIRLTANDLPDGPMRGRVEARLTAWLSAMLRKRLAALYAFQAAADSAPLRGLSFQLFESGGVLTRKAAKPLIGALDPEGRKKLAPLGLRLGRDAVYLDGLMQARAIRLKALLWAVWTGRDPPAIPAKAPVLTQAGALDAADWAMIGYRRLGAHALRVDQAERLAALARRAAADGPFAAEGPFAEALPAADPRTLEALLRALGYRAEDGPDGIRRFRAKSRKPGREPARPRAGGPKRQDRATREADRIAASPFAKLKALVET